MWNTAWFLVAHSFSALTMVSFRKPANASSIGQLGGYPQLPWITGKGAVALLRKPVVAPTLWALGAHEDG